MRGALVLALFDLASVFEMDLIVCGKVVTSVELSHLLSRYSKKKG